MAQNLWSNSLKSLGDFYNLITSLISHAAAYKNIEAGSIISAYP